MFDTTISTAGTGLPSTTGALENLPGGYVVAELTLGPVRLTPPPPSQFDHALKIIERRQARSNRRLNIAREEGRALLPEGWDSQPVYNCRLWSDGILEVRENGNVIAEIPRAAGECIVGLFNKMNGKRKVTV